MMPLPAGHADTVAASHAASARELAALRRDFPHFRLWREATGSRVRYVAVRQRPGTSLHTLVTADLTELRPVLAEAAARMAHPGRPGDLPGVRGRASASGGPPPALSEAPVADADAARWKEASQLRSAFTGWLVIWVARAGRFHGYPLARSRAGATVTAATADELAAQMSRVDRADRADRRAGGGGAAGLASTPDSPGVTGLGGG